LKLYPTTDGYRVDNAEAFEVYETAVGIGMPIMLHHVGMSEPGDLLKHLDPTLIDVVAHSSPDLKIILAYLGYPRVDETHYVAW